MPRLLIATLLVACLGFATPAGSGDTHDPLAPLFERLRVTHDRREAGALESMIWALWAKYEGDRVEVGFLMHEGLQAIQRNEYDKAVRAFDEVTTLAPDFPEGWNQRATAEYLRGDYPAALADMRRTLRLEPRHFGALSGLGMVYMSLGDMERALKAFDAALGINPHMDMVRAHRETVREKLAGEPV